MNPKIARNPWEERILRCLKDPDLSERLRYRPAALPDLQAMPADTAAVLVRERLQEVYVPSPPKTAAVRRMLGVCHAHCLTHYASVDHYEHHVRNGAPPGALSSGPVVTPQITIPLVKAVPDPVDPPALRGGKPAPVGGINDAAARCEAQADVQARARCRDRLARETPVRPPG